MNLQEAKQNWLADKAHLAMRGVHMDDVKCYMPEAWKHNFALAMDEAPGLSTISNSAIPMILTTSIDPQIFEVLFSPLTAAEILSEVKKGTWLDDTIMFPVVERTGEVSSYGDYNENGSAGANTNYPQRQNYIFQTMTQYGQRELERQGLAKLNWVAELDKSAAWAINNFQNQSYFYGIYGLENYGLINDPGLSAPLTPAPKAAGGNAWINGNGVVVATANEIYSDLQSLAIKLVQQSGGTIKPQETELVLALAPEAAMALTQVNSFNVDVQDLLNKNFKKFTVVTAVQYGERTASNPLGNAGGNLVQLIAKQVEGQDTGYCAFSEKMRSSPLIQATSSFKQKKFAGTWGAVIRQPFAVAQMLGV